MNQINRLNFWLGRAAGPICAIIVGGAIAIVAMVHRHQERIAKIERGIDPDVRVAASASRLDER